MRELQSSGKGYHIKYATVKIILQLAITLKGMNKKGPRSVSIFKCSLYRLKRYTLVGGVVGLKFYSLSFGALPEITYVVSKAWSCERTHTHKNRSRAGFCPPVPSQVVRVYPMSTLSPVSLSVRDSTGSASNCRTLSTSPRLCKGKIR